jgi:hypothetical protein
MNGKEIVDQWQRDQMHSVALCGYAPLVAAIDHAIASARAEGAANAVAACDALRARRKGCGRSERRVWNQSIDCGFTLNITPDITGRLSTLFELGSNTMTWWLWAALWFVIGAILGPLLYYWGLCAWMWIDNVRARRSTPCL